MYTDYFRLQEQPFSIAPDPRYLYMSPRHQEALAHLIYGLEEGGGFVALTGEVGTGKTTLCHCLLNRLPDDVDLALILNPRLNAVELLASLCDELDIAYPPECSSLKILVDRLNHYLLDAHGRGRRTVVMIDEAQNLSLEVLEQIRLLTNLETTRTKLLQIILVGQPELNRTLARKELRQLLQRITARYHLEPLSYPETRAYIAHRLAVSGAAPDLFDGAAIRKVYRYAHGVPRLINIICDRALLGAYSTGRDRVTQSIVVRAARELFAVTDRRWYQRLRSPALAAAAAIIGVILVGGLGYLPLPAGFAPPSSATGSQPLLQKADAGLVNGAEPLAVPRPAEEQVPASVVTLMPAIEEANPAPRPDFAVWLRDFGSGQDSAFADLYALWGLGDASAETKTCDGSAANGLRCLAQQGSWQKLRRFDRPAVLEFMLDDGTRRYATLAAMEAGEPVLVVQGKRYRFSLDEVLVLWQGYSALLWQPPVLHYTWLKFGDISPQVNWLRESLPAAYGPETPAPNPERFDAPLRQAVVAFQGDHGLRQDGVIGPNTVIFLNNSRSSPGIPRLSMPSD